MATDAAPRFAVVMRTYQWDPFIRRQMQRYQCVAAGGDLFVSADETHGPLGDFDGLPALRTTNAQLVALGLADRFEKGSLIWWNGDYPSYAFLHAYPNYDYYVFVEYDSVVRVPLARVVQEVAEAGVDFVAAPIPGPLNKWFWWPYVRAAYDPAELRATLNCICILSRRSLRLLFDRRVDMGRDPSLARWPISEAFVATELARAGHVFAPLSRFGDDSAYDWFPRCLTAGTLGGVLSVPNVSSWRGYRLGDGTAVWVDDGIAPPDAFDVRAAARAAWLLKASRAAQYFDVKSPGQVFDQSQVYKHCTEMADRFRSVFVA